MERLIDRGTVTRIGLAVVALSLVLGFYGVPHASAAITDASADELAAAIANDANQVSSASTDFEEQPNSSTDGLATTVIAPFPTHGSSYGILSTGDATEADDPDASASTDFGGGTPVNRGDSAFDVTIMRIALTVPSGTNCLGIDFRFLSEEFPDPENDFNDAFIAELDASTWTTSSSAINAPGNFAFDQSGAVISVNSTSGVSPENAAGTPYDNATPVLRARTSVAPGAHSVYLSIFDQVDHILDSAVFVDNLRSFATSDCKSGAAPPTDDPPPPEPPAPPAADPPPPEPPADPLVSGPPPEPSPIETLDEPVVGENFNAAAVDGKVKRRCDDDNKFVELESAEQLPVGCTLDTRNGTVLLVSSTGTDGETRSGEFWDGVFRVSQKARKGRKQRGSKNVKTNLALTGSLGCGGKDKRVGDRSVAGLHSQARKGKKKKKGNGLWGRGGGGHRTRGRRGSGTVRGTTWRTVDRCDGSTLFKVTEGKVEVDDFGKKKDVILEAGESYVAKRSRRR